MNKRQFKILIVDDDFSSRRLLARFISGKWSVKILEAQEGSEALRIISEERPDLVLLDMMMPFMSGLEFLKILRGNSKMKDTVVIACTSVDDKTTVSEIIQYGVHGYIVKPFDRKVLIKKISTVVDIPSKK
ncbi:MAG: PleD family two-component system response regulator [bacterium]